MIFNLTHLEHLGIGLAIQSLAGFALGNWIIGAVFAFAFFFGREVAQAEYKWIEKNGGLRAKMPNFEGLKIHKWSLDAILDVLVPLVAMVGVVLVKMFLFP
jgi:hypothetical protein